MSILFQVQGGRLPGDEGLVIAMATVLAASQQFMRNKEVPIEWCLICRYITKKQSKSYNFQNPYCAVLSPSFLTLRTSFWTVCSPLSHLSFAPFPFQNYNWKSIKTRLLEFSLNKIWNGMKLRLLFIIVLLKLRNVQSKLIVFSCTIQKLHFSRRWIISY